MNLRTFAATFALLSAALLGGCATPIQRALNLPADYLATTKAKQGRMGVVMAELPKPDTAFPGADCLLCIGVANGVHSVLNKEVQAFSTAELKTLPSDLAGLLKKQGLEVVLIDEPLKMDTLPDIAAVEGQNKSRKNFSSFKAKHNIDKLLVVQFTALGVWRSYSAYIPTDVPRATAKGLAYIVDLNTQALDWYLPLPFSQAAAGNWNEPPKYPGLTNAYFQVLETTMDAIKKSLVP